MATLLSMDELEARKRLIQARMELHRIEMAVYSHQILSPFQTVRHGFEKIAAHPILRWGIIGGFGFLATKLRLRLVGRLAGIAVPLVMGRIRGIVLGPVARMGVRVLSNLVFRKR